MYSLCDNVSAFRNKGFLQQHRNASWLCLCCGGNTKRCCACKASYGVNLIRFFGNIDGDGRASGYGYTDTTRKSILVSIDPTTLVGTYNETNFRRFDLVLAEACKLAKPT